MMHDKNMIGFFHEYDEYGFCSNWYPSEFYYANRHYLSAEQFMMQQKMSIFRRHDIAEAIMQSTSPSEAKRLGRTKIPEFDSSIWDKVCYPVAKRGIRAKFAQNPVLLQQLLDTGHAIMAECSPYDDIWGIKLDITDPRHWDVSQWRGKNYLGRILMEVREELRNRQAAAPNHRIPLITPQGYSPIDVCDFTFEELAQNPKFTETINAYADTLDERSRNAFMRTRLKDLELMMARNHGGGLPAAGFYEMQQDIYEIVLL